MKAKAACVFYLSSIYLLLGSCLLFIDCFLLLSGKRRRRNGNKEFPVIAMIFSVATNFGEQQIEKHSEIERPLRSSVDSWLKQGR